MQVHAAAKNDPVITVASAASKKQTTSVPQQASKADTLVLSEKAKDLAAIKAGKGAQEEAKESITAKMKEGDTD